MSFYPEQADINVLYQTQKRIYAKVEILDSNYMVLDTVTGKLVSDSFNVDANSNIRRTYNFVMQVTESTIDFSRTGVLWFDKYIRPYVGIYDAVRKKVVWYLKGTFCSANATHSYTADNNTLNVNCNDMMCRLTGDLDGVQTGLSFKIEVGQDIRQSLIGIIKVFGFTQYRIDTLPRPVQYDLEFGAGATGYDMISQLMEFCPNYEFFFDLDGTFVVQRIPCYTNDGDILDESVIEDMLVSEDSYTVNFTAKNCVEIWGKAWTDDSVDRFAETCTYENNVYTATFEEWSHASSFTVTSTIDASLNPSINEEKFRSHIEEATNSYTVTYRTSTNDWLIERLDDPTILPPKPSHQEWTVSYAEAESSWGIHVNSAPPDGAHFDVSLIIPETMPYEYMVFAVTMPANNQANFRMALAGKESGIVGIYDVVNDYGEGVAADTLQKDTTYIFEFTQGHILYLGNITVHAEYKNQDDSKFSIAEMGREYWAVFSGGEYDNITSDILAKERAMYECYYKASLNESLSLTTVDIPWLDVNKKISYMRKNSNEVERWMIKSISSQTLNGTCNISLVKFYPDWSEIFRRELL